MDDAIFLYDDTEETRTRFVGFIGENRRFDLALTTTDRFYGKKLVHDVQSGRSAIIGQDDLKEDGYLEQTFQLNEEDATELHDFLVQII